jgi:hypothetical protein
MKKKRVLWGILALALVFGFVLMGCGSSPKAAATDLTGVSSYYVRADGDDKNAGTSEAAPFKTLKKAVEAAAKTPVKKITVIGTLTGTVINKTDPTPRSITNYVKVEGDKVWYAGIKWSLDENDPDEILITGKPDASGAERAVLKPAKEGDNAILLIASSTVRLEHIELSGLNTTKPGSTVMLLTGTLTLARGTKITKNSGNISGINVMNGVVIMRDDAEISGNEGESFGAGAFLSSGSVLVMLDKSRITGNKAAEAGGGAALAGSTLIMRGSAAITGNSAANRTGGGVYTEPNTEDGYFCRITMYDDAVIEGNAAKGGGGIYLQGELIMEGNAKITGNTAAQAGGGIWGAGDNNSLTLRENAVIEGNTAPEFPDTNFVFE